MNSTASPVDIKAMRAAAGRATAMLRVLANEDRLLLLCQLTHGELSVTELEQRLDIRQPTLSQQLGVLRACGMVSTRRAGTRIYYTIADDHALGVLEQLYASYCVSS
jgi:ArsR family transcriptional regulator